MKILLVVLLADGVDTDGKTVAPGDEAILSADTFAQPSALKPDNYTQAQIHQANDMLAAALGTTNVVVPGTGHNQMLYQQQAIADQIVTVVDDVRVRP
jgi:hypothetical protein